MIQRKKKSKYNLLILKALEFFIENPYTEIYLREFSRKLKISPNTAQRFLDLFLKEKLVIEVKKANLRYFKANLNSNLFKHMKIAFSIGKIEKFGLIKNLKNHVSHCILFGSVAKGLDDEKSDIDLLIITDNKKMAREILLEHINKFHREINYHIFSWVEWKNQKKNNLAFYQDVIANGINLIGEIPIVD